MTKHDFDNILKQNFDSIKKCLHKTKKVQLNYAISLSWKVKNTTMTLQQ